MDVCVLCQSLNASHLRCLPLGYKMQPETINSVIERAVHKLIELLSEMRNPIEY